MRSFQFAFTTAHLFVDFLLDKSNQKKLDQIKRYMHTFMVISFGLFMRKNYMTFNKLYRQIAIIVGTILLLINHFPIYFWKFCGYAELNVDTLTEQCQI